VARLLGEPGLAALVGAPDGASAHVAVQAATKRRVPVITLCPEESLTRAGDPWVFRAVPDDASQARALLRRARLRGRKALLVVPEGREGRERRRSLESACRDSGVTVAGAPAEGGDAVLLWLDPPEARAWFAGPVPRALVLASSRLDDPAFLDQAPAAAEGMLLPLGGALQAAAYDAVAAVVSAVRSQGPLPAQVRAGLAASGRFGPKGDRSVDIDVGVLRQGRLAALER
jgi:hypothetical protein